MHGPRIPNRPAKPEPDGPAVEAMAINVARVPGPDGPVVIIECTVGDRRMVGVLDPAVARRLGTKLQELGSVVELAVAGS
jgi:hypothetical protein